MQNNNTAIIVLAVAILGLGALFMFKNTQRVVVVPTTDTTTETTEPTDTTTTMPADEDETATTVKTFEIHAGMPYFRPNTIQVNKGDTVRIKLINDGGMHDLVIDEFNVQSAILKADGETDEIEFVADQAGTFEYYCSIMNHRAMGMVGTLVVTDAAAQ